MLKKITFLFVLAMLATLSANAFKIYVNYPDDVTEKYLYVVNEDDGADVSAAWPGTKLNENDYVIFNFKKYYYFEVTDGLWVTAIPNDGPVSSDPMDEESMTYHFGVTSRTENVEELYTDRLITIDGTNGTIWGTEIVKWTYDLDRLMPGVHRSRYVFDDDNEIRLNSYKNTIKIFDYDSYSSITLMRKYNTSSSRTVKSTVATITLNTDGTYTVTYPDDSWSANTEQENRYDEVAANASGNIADGIVVDDYFYGQDEWWNSYTYYVGEAENDWTGTFVVKTCIGYTYTGLSNTKATDEYRDGYTKAQITNDTDRKLSTTGVVLQNELQDYSGYTNDDIKKIDVYRNGILLATVDNSEDFTYNVVTDPVDSEEGREGEASYTLVMKVPCTDETGNVVKDEAGNVVYNAYGSPHQSTARFVSTTGEIAEDADGHKFWATNNYTFHDGSKYYTCYLNNSYACGDPYSCKIVGIRVWRDCETADEIDTKGTVDWKETYGYKDNFMNRAKDFLFFEAFTTGASEELDDYGSYNVAFQNIGKEAVGTYVKNETEANVESGTFGSTTLPEVTYHIRVYYRYSLVEAPMLKPEGDESEDEETDTDKYFVADHDLTISFPANDIQTAITDVTAAGQNAVKASKVVENGQIYIIAGDKKFNVMGQEIK